MRLMCYRILQILTVALVVGANTVFVSHNAHRSIDFEEIQSEESIGLSVNRSATTTRDRHRSSVKESRSTYGSNHNSQPPIRINQPSSEPQCRNRSHRLAAMVDPNFECDPAIPPEMSGRPASRPSVETEPQFIEEVVEIVITTSDLMELIPSTPQIVMDRGPFGLKNAHTNFYASNHQAQTVTETMFGQEVTIVATPIEYRWDYGDGNTLTTQTPGRPVETFNVETETSHQFTEPGNYTVTLTTVFEGTYQVDGGPTQAVSSTVTQQADPVEIEIWRAVTRNVDQTCGQNPQAWGC